MSETIPFKAPEPGRRRALRRALALDDALDRLGKRTLAWPAHEAPLPDSEACLSAPNRLVAHRYPAVVVNAPRRRLGCIRLAVLAMRPSPIVSTSASI